MKIKTQYLICSSSNGVRHNATWQILINSNIDYEFRTTIVKEYHSIDEFTKIGELIKGAKKYFLQCYQYRDSVREKTLNAMTKEELTLCLEKVKPYVVYAALREID